MQILGQEITGKRAMVLLGVIVAGVAVVVWVRSRGGGEQPVYGVPQDTEGGGGGGFFGGGGGGVIGQPITVEAPTDAAAERYEQDLRDIQLDAARFSLERQRREAGEQERQAGLMFQVNEAWARLQENLFGQETQVGASRAAYEAEAFRTAEAAQRRQTEVAAKAPVKCPPGMHPANVPGEGLVCRRLGDPDGGRGFQPFRQVGNIFGGILRGIGMAAPEIGYGAAHGYAAQAGIPGYPQQPRQQPQRTVGTPPFVPQGYTGV